MGVQAFFPEPSIEAFHRGIVGWLAQPTELDLHTIRIHPLIDQAELGTPIEELCRQHGVSQQSFYRWKKVYGGMLPSEARELKSLRDENTKLKRLVADLSLDKVMLQDVVQKKW